MTIGDLKALKTSHRIRFFIARCTTTVHPDWVFTIYVVFKLDIMHIYKAVYHYVVPFT